MLLITLKKILLMSVTVLYQDLMRFQDQDVWQHYAPVESFYPIKCLIHVPQKYSYPQPISHKYHSYPQVYPQINVTDNIIR